MAWTTPETFTAGQTLTAASMNIVSGNLRMGGPVFTNEAARDAAITAPEEGMTAYLTAPTVPAATGSTTMVPTGITTIYNGTAWVCVTPIGGYQVNDGTTTSASFTASLSGTPGTNPSVTLTTGTTALVSIRCGYMQCSLGSGNLAFMGFAVSGATTLAASDERTIGVVNNVTNIGVGASLIVTGLTSGTNTFTLNYRSSGGATGSWQRREIIVQGIA